jgi:hypothetical protein
VPRTYVLALTSGKPRGIETFPSPDARPPGRHAHPEPVIAELARCGREIQYWPDCRALLAYAFFAEARGWPREALGMFSEMIMCAVG